MTDTELAYLAGIIDADGYVTATRSTHKGRLYFGAQIGTTGSRPRASRPSRRTRDEYPATAAPV